MITIFNISNLLLMFPLDSPKYQGSTVTAKKAVHIGHKAIFHMVAVPSRKSLRYWDGVTPSTFLNTLVNTR